MAKSLPEDIQLMMQSLLVNRLIPKYGHRSAVARASGFSASAIHRLEKYGQGSWMMVRKFAELLGYKDEHELISVTRQPSLGNAEGFKEALEDARRALGSHYSDEVWARVATVVWNPPVRKATVALIIKTAEAAALAITLDGWPTESVKMSIPPKSAKPRTER